MPAFLRRTLFDPVQPGGALSIASPAISALATILARDNHVSLQLDSTLVHFPVHH